MLGSHLVFGTRYGASHLLGAALILVGVGFALQPTFAAATSGGSGGGGGAAAALTARGDNSELLFNFIYFLAVLPMVLATLYKEAAMSDDDIDGNYLNAKIGVWQIGFTVLCQSLCVLCCPFGWSLETWQCTTRLPVV